ncbi:MAG: hypothetical protein RL481_2377, partial [Pseudomonadota bacterium]
MPARSIGRTSCVVLMMASMTACASIDSRPQSLRLERDALTNFKLCDYGIAKRLSDASLIELNRTNFCGGARTTQDVRNAFITYAMDLVDARYKDFIIGLSREAKSNNLGFNFISLALTAGATVAGERTANALSAGATAITGTRDSFNKDVLYEQTIAALIDEMYAMRSDARKPILTGMAQPADKYTIDMAARDIEAYDEAADLNRAFQRLVQSAAQRAQQAKAEEADLKSELIACQPTQDLIVPRAKAVAYLDGLADDQSGNAKLQS